MKNSHHKRRSSQVLRSKRRKHHKLSLRELLQRITPENVQPTYDWGRDIGTE